MKRTALLVVGRPVAAIAAALGFICIAAGALAADQVAGSQLVPAAQPPWAHSSTTAPAAAPAQASGASQGPPAAPSTPPKSGARTEAAKTEPPGMPPPPAVPTAAAKTEQVPAAPVASAKIPPPARPTAPTVAQTGSTEPPPSEQPGGTALLQSPLAVTRWGFSATAQPDAGGGLTIVAKAGRPLQLWLTIEGGEAAVEQLRDAGRIAITVHWERADKSAPGAQDLNTELTVGRPGLASTFAEQVQKQGHFEWHLWSRKDALSPGQWTVSLTYPDGSPVQCGQASPRPCRLSLNVS